MLVNINRYDSIFLALEKCFTTHSPDYLQRVLDKDIVVLDELIHSDKSNGFKCLIFLDRITENYLCFGVTKEGIYDLSLFIPNISSSLILFIKQNQYNFTVLEGVVNYEAGTDLYVEKPVLLLTDLLFFDGRDIRKQSYISRWDILEVCLVDLKSKSIKHRKIT